MNINQNTKDMNTLNLKNMKTMKMAVAYIKSLGYTEVKTDFINRGYENKSRLFNKDEYSAICEYSVKKGVNIIY